jgi:hypothetical protein
VAPTHRWLLIASYLPVPPLPPSSAPTSLGSLASENLGLGNLRLAAGLIAWAGGLK